MKRGKKRLAWKYSYTIFQMPENSYKNTILWGTENSLCYPARFRYRATYPYLSENKNLRENNRTVKITFWKIWQGYWNSHCVLGSNRIWILRLYVMKNFILIYFLVTTTKINVIIIMFKNIKRSSLLLHY